AGSLRDQLGDAGIRVALDSRVDTAFGRRAVDAELKGYPVRVEIGPRDLAAGNVVLVRRVDGSKTPVTIGQLPAMVAAALDADQKARYATALTRRLDNTVEVSTVEEALEASGTGWARLPWAAVGSEGERKVNAQGVTVRCLTRADGSVPDSEDEPELIAYLARAY